MGKLQIKPLLKAVIPERIRAIPYQRKLRQLRGLPMHQLFDDIYRSRWWGNGSGPGSHDPALVQPYIEAVRAFLSSFETPPRVVDLGCGDFAVGSQLVPFCGSYVGCDVAQSVVEQNRTQHPDVDFRTLDITADEFPPGDIATLRQVLQHLSNADIQRVIPRLYQYTYLVLTEHWPADDHFPRNLDKPTGPDIRSRLNGSAIDLTSEPFNLRFEEARQICEVRDDDLTRIMTTVYRLR